MDTKPTRRSPPDAIQALRWHRRLMRLLGAVRPAMLVDPLVRRLQRHRYQVAYGDLVLSISPYSFLGKCVLDGAYEADVESLLRRYLPAGGCFFDVGANEGFYCALAARVVGDSGRIVAIEPQRALQPLIEINTRLNGGCGLTVCRAVASAGSESGRHKDVHLFPTVNHGASGVVRPYRFGNAVERVECVSIDVLAVREGVERIDLMKIDVEGYEWEVVQGMDGMLGDRRIGTVLIDYHASLLAKRGLSLAMIEGRFFDAGYERVHGEPREGYAVYRVRE